MQETKSKLSFGEELRSLGVSYADIMEELS